MIRTVPDDPQERWIMDKKLDERDRMRRMYQEVPRWNGSGELLGFNRWALEFSKFLQINELDHTSEQNKKILIFAAMEEEGTSLFKLSINCKNLLFQLESINYGSLFFWHMKYFYKSVLGWELLCWTLIFPIDRSGYPLWALLFWGPMRNLLLSVIPPGYDKHAGYWID